MGFIVRNRWPLEKVFLCRIHTVDPGLLFQRRFESSNLLRLGFSPSNSRFRKFKIQKIIWWSTSDHRRPCEFQIASSDVNEIEFINWANSIRKLVVTRHRIRILSNEKTSETSLWFSVESTRRMDVYRNTFLCFASLRWSCIALRSSSPAEL